ncbi:NapC/NirT family cytochrome c [Thioalkalivibrio paradoxus]|uniref:Cytochrome c-type protein n=1 Tax=Thioalkalivibrio paradoxus ARh 1 TaxID=713585 RepID=W0DL81_9GAMM|nr:NapC/NirT family cytochrome c [Thioalkalivibrio paradoxus]AHE98022.1 cytochrome C protein NapC [Thioalkalivibrio paradoxus ARh 1]
MSDQPKNPERRGLWGWPRTRWLLGIPIGGILAFIVGAAAMVGSSVAIEATSSDAFCATACHSHEEFVYPEWKESIHYSNPSGVRAGCADCHIPQHYPDKLIVKTTSGIRDSYHEFVLRSISTRERFEDRRGEMAERVWERMRANDSQACRNCHHVDSFSGQSARAERMHRRMETTDNTCIDCHEGVAHLHPADAARKYAADD